MYGLFNDAVSSSGSVVFSGKMIVEQWIGKLKEG
jgi:hypothetical protein